MTNACDTNVLLYLALPHNPKSDRAREIVEEGGIISVQVLNEFIAVAVKKLKLELSSALMALDPIKDAFTVVPITVETHELAMDIAARTNFRVYDCNIIAAAELSGCDVLYTEDLNHGQKVGRVEIRNPFIVAQKGKF
jgi:predicted nucleic acid-binding protein